MKKIAVLFFIILFSYTSFGQNEKIEYKIYPVDESKKDISISQFVDNLKQILITKDTFKLYNLFDERIVTSFGGALYGKQDFILVWELDEPQTSEVWTKMLDVIELGGVFDLGGVFAETKEDTIFQFPYANAEKLYSHFYNQKLEFDLDPFYTLVCLNENVPLYKSPNSTSDIIDSLSYDILSMDYIKTYEEMTKNQSSTWEWIYVTKMDNSISGWIYKGEDFYSLGGYKLIIENNNNEYKITGFFPYD